MALVIEGDTVQIRPDPENTPQAFRADKLLQTFVSKRRIKFLNVLNERVRDAVKRRGECWRIAPLPTSPTEMKERISASKIGIRGKEIYYYNSTTGTRLLTYQEFSRLGSLDESQLRQHLAEIREFSAKGEFRMVTRKSPSSWRTTVSTAIHLPLTISVCSMRNNCGQPTKTSDAVSMTRSSRSSGRTTRMMMSGGIACSPH